MLDHADYAASKRQHELDNKDEYIIYLQCVRVPDGYIYYS